MFAFVLISINPLLFSPEKFSKTSRQVAIYFSTKVTRQKNIQNLQIQEKYFLLQKNCPQKVYGNEELEKFFSYYWFCDPLGLEECSNKEKGTAYFDAFFFFHFWLNTASLHIFTTFYYTAAKPKFKYE